MKRIQPLALLSCLAVSSPTGAASPNILVILADDAGYADFGFQGGGIDGDFADLTPRLDSLAASGVRFTNGYVTGPICCPSRAGLITGRYQQRFGMEDNIRDFQNAGLAPFQATVADRLRSLGYRTYAIGKWHLGDDLPDFHPNRRGFDEFTGFLAGARTYYEYSGGDPSCQLQHNGVPLDEQPGQYLTEVFGGAAASFVDAHLTDHPDQPFFMYLAFNALHTPLEAEPDTLEDDPRIQGLPDENRKTLAAMTIAMDDAVGVVLDKLDEREIREDTLVVFLNDNGGPEDNPELEGRNWSDNGPLRAGKTSLYEGGIRVPFVVSWPGTIPAGPGPAGRVLDDPVIALDLLPTFVAAAGGRLFPDIETDGANLLPRLTGEAPRPLERCLFWRIAGPVHGQRAARLGSWKLYRKGTDPAELYDLAADVGESNDLAATYPERVTELLAAYAEWERGVIEPLWGRGAMAPSAPDVLFRPAPLGYHIEKSDPGYGYVRYGLGEPLSLGEDWILEWRLESLEAANRNGYVILGDGLAADGVRVTNVIRIGVDFDTAVMSILETQNGAGSNLDVPGIAPESLDQPLRLEYDATTRTLVLHYRARTLSHALTGTYSDLSQAGFALQSAAAANFSSIQHHLVPLSPPASPSWTRLEMTSDYTPGSVDVDGNFMGGTEALSLIAHKGRLFAGIGYWNDDYFGEGSPDPYPGAQVLVKDAARAPWRQDVAFGPEALRVDSLRSLTVTTDKNGAPLEPPVTLLLAGTMPPFPHDPPITDVLVFVRNDDTGVWTPTSPGTVNSGFAAARVLFDHVDRVTGVHHLFCAYGYGATAVVRGGYDQATGLIEWQPEPELTGTNRILSGGECNGWLYACIGSDGDPYNDTGGVFWREDGPDPQWHLVREFRDHPNEVYEDVRGFTAVPHPKGLGYDVALVAQNSWSRVTRIDPIGGDPRNDHVVTDEVDIEQFLGDFWSDGLPIEDNIIAAYNDMPELVDPASGEPVHFLGIWVKHHPAGPDTPEDRNSWYLIRRLDATYDWGQVIDPANPLPPDGRRGCRAARPSPFPEEAGRVLYVGGFDAANPYWHNTAWIYRAELADVRVAFERGDCDGDGKVNLTDAVRDLRFCFSDADVPCREACDTDGDGNPCSGVTDGVRLLVYLFRGGPAPPAPFGECGTLEGEVDCESPPAGCR